MKKFELSARVRPSLLKAIHDTVNELISLHIMKASCSFEIDPRKPLNAQSDSKMEDSGKGGSQSIVGESIHLEIVSPSLRKKNGNLDTNGLEITSRESKQHKKKRKRANKRLCVSGFLFEHEKESNESMKKKSCCSIF